jgi:hypothetical protein
MDDERFATLNIDTMHTDQKEHIDARLCYAMLCNTDSPVLRIALLSKQAPNFWAKKRHYWKIMELFLLLLRFVYQPKPAFDDVCPRLSV